MATISQIIILLIVIKGTLSTANAVEVLENGAESLTSGDINAKSVVINLNIEDSTTKLPEISIDTVKEDDITGKSSLENLDLREITTKPEELPTETTKAEFSTTSSTVQSLDTTDIIQISVEKMDLQAEVQSEVLDGKEIITKNSIENLEHKEISEKPEELQNEITPNLDTVENSVKEIESQAEIQTEVIDGSEMSTKSSIENLEHKEIFTRPKELQNEITQNLDTGKISVEGVDSQAEIQTEVVDEKEIMEKNSKENQEHKEVSTKPEELNNEITQNLDYAEISMKGVDSQDEIQTEIVPEKEINEKNAIENLEIVEIGANNLQILEITRNSEESKLDVTNEDITTTTTSSVINFDFSELSTKLEEKQAEINETNTIHSSIQNLETIEIPEKSNELKSEIIVEETTLQTPVAIEEFTETSEIPEEQLKSITTKSPIVLYVETRQQETTSLNTTTNLETKSNSSETKAETEEISSETNVEEVTIKPLLSLEDYAVKQLNFIIDHVLLASQEFVYKVLQATGNTRFQRDHLKHYAEDLDYLLNPDDYMAEEEEEEMQDADIIKETSLDDPYNIVLKKVEFLKGDSTKELQNHLPPDWIRSYKINKAEESIWLDKAAEQLRSEFNQYISDEEDHVKYQYFNESFDDISRAGEIHQKLKILVDLLKIIKNKKQITFMDLYMQ